MNIENPAVKAICESDYSQTVLAEEFGCSLWYFNRVVNRRLKSRPLEQRIAKKIKIEVVAIFPDREKKKRGPRASASTEGRAAYLNRGSALASRL